MYYLSKEELQAKLNFNEKHGLSEKEADKRLSIYGENSLVEEKGQPLLKRILNELFSFLNVLLLIAALISILASKHLTDGLFIIAIVFLNTALSIYQEQKAKNAVSALKKISSPKAKVLRDGIVKHISSTKLVVGDIVLCEAGDSVPADIYLLETVNLKIGESTLTGESTSVEKDAYFECKENTPLADRQNMAYMGTTVTYGRANGVVVATGMDTEIGHIATLLNEVEDEKTPLQEKIGKLGKQLGTISVIIVALIFLIGILYDILGITSFKIIDLFLVSVSLAVAAIPEGLPSVITLVLSLGMKKMAKQKAIVKSLSAVETLGSTTVIASDKTGTLTENKMLVTRVFDNDKLFEVTGKGYEFSGEIKGNSEVITKIAKIGLLCNDASINGDELIGDPTELALLPFAYKAGLDISSIKKQITRIDEYPFDSERKRMSVLIKDTNQYYLYTKGAPEKVLEVCTHYQKNGEIFEINEKFKQLIILANEGMARNAMRVLAFAYKKTNGLATAQNEEQNLIFTGMVGITDPPRKEVQDAIKVCKEAGIRVVMITGDHKITASAIGQQLGIIDDVSQAISTEDLDELTDEELSEKIEHINVFARVSPKHKVRIVTSLQRIGNICAMTGDGVNDAPALKKADIGIAMGISGTDVSKEAADMVLMDDNFTTIVTAVEEGRVIFQNIRKFVGYLVSCNVGEVLLIFIAMLLSWGSPLLPVQILWINLVTDSFPAFALGLEAKEDGIMKRPPINPQAQIVDKKMLIAISFQSVFLAFAVLISFYIGKNIYNGTYELASTLAFTTIITGELLRTFSARSESKTIFSMNPFQNKWINISTIIGFFLLLGVLFIPGINTIFHTDVDLTFNQFIIALALGFIPLIGGELAKIFK